ncbi:coenzyme F420-0:L-glutamate ligase [Candidatus Bathyarchaeota archaeon]|nr:coenzyme F420-0:L-glutamate ligase [Candidatus Bathyarchaeota archaeon]MBS7631548.1 coenzyme F420-0:L-glutamate ligase [Candidatus Bathyarchaeota archaeon]
MTLKIKAIKIITGYWKPGTDYLSEIASKVAPLVQDGDIVTVSEKAIVTSKGLIIDESRVQPSSLAKFLSKYWMRLAWGTPIGYLTRLKPRTRARLRNYPIEAGALHKQTVLRRVGFLQSLRHYSEGGIDASNLPFFYVSLPLPNPEFEAEKIRQVLEKSLNKKLTVMIVDGDTTYSWRNLHLAPRRVNVPGLIHFGGFLTFVIGRMLNLKPRSTPIGLSRNLYNPDWCLTLAEIAHRVRGDGAGRTVWDMEETFRSPSESITWEMMERVEHAAVVLLRLSK